MTLNDYLVLFGLLIVFFGIGLLLYVQVLGLILRFHLILFPKIHSQILQLENQDPSAK
jgi:hypothetical protein